MTALIIGGGIGGLAAGLALRRAGLTVRVVEQAPEIREVGAGIGLWSNAMRALAALGVAERILSRASVFDRIRTVLPSGAPLAEYDVGDVARRAGAPSVCIHRADLQEQLADALGVDCIETGARCVAVEEDQRGAVAHLADGRDLHAELLVGADGVNSVVRGTLLGTAPPRYAGYVAWRGVASAVEADLPPATALFVLHPGAQMGLFRCGPRGLYWFVTQNGPPLAERPRRDKHDLLEAFSPWHPVLRAAVEATRDVLLNDVVDRRPVRTWGRGPITLLGDAAHPTTPNLAQGACQAIEDAVFLGAALRREHDPERALRDYERRRRRRTAMITLQSRALGALYQWENRTLVALRDRLLATRLSERQTRFALERLLCAELPDL